MQRIGIIGFGFCGNLVVAHLVRQSAMPCEIIVVDPALDGVGIAYGTKEPGHLLNVPAANMSAFAAEPDHFLQWIRKHSYDVAATDFAPRMLYGDYLRDIWAESQALAEQHGHRIKLVPSTAVAINAREDDFSLVTARGDAIAVDHLVLATGNETKPISPPSPIPASVPVKQQPYATEDGLDPWQSGRPVLVLGSGLSAADMVMARPYSYQWPLYVRSRNGRWPQAHAPQDTPPAKLTIAFEELPVRLLPLLRWVRMQARRAADWRGVVDALRPHTQAVWQRLSEREQRQFLRHLAGFWSIHRHRMPPQAASTIAAECAHGFVQLQPSLDALQHFTVRVAKLDPQTQELTEGTAEVPLGAVINCTGWQLNLTRSAQPLYKQLLDHGLIEQHGTGLGLRADPKHRVWGHAYPRLYAMGALLSGQLLESTAVPELRVQAQQIAEELCRS